MSAFIIGKDHIDLMVCAAVNGSGLNGGLRIFHDGEVRHITREHADEVGQILHSWNVHSVNYRYNEETLPDRYTYDGTEITQHMGGAGIPWAHVLNAIACYEYQSCEDTAGWPKSEAHAICEALRHKVCNTLARLADAPWEWTRSHARERLDEIKSVLLARMES